jgi:hypothetical protein
MSAHELQSLAQQFCEAFNKKDLKTALGMLSDDLEVFDHVPYRFDNKEQFATLGACRVRRTEKPPRELQTADPGCAINRRTAGGGVIVAVTTQTGDPRGDGVRPGVNPKGGKSHGRVQADLGGLTFCRAAHHVGRAD